MNRLKEAAKEAKMDMDDVSARMAFYKKNVQNHAANPAIGHMTVADISRLDDKDVTLSPGQIFKRVSLNPEQGVDPLASVKRVYASYQEKDILTYRGYMEDVSEYFANRKVGQNIYEVTISAKKNIKIASPKKLYDTYKEMLSADGPEGSIFRTEALRLHHMVMGKIDPRLTHTAEAINKSVLNDVDLFSRDSFKSFCVGHATDSQAVKDFFSKMISKGYDAIPDLNDMGRLTDRPTIIINPDSIVYKGVEVVTDGAKRAARIALHKGINHSALKGGSMHISPEEFLEHYGVKGMKWGVRKASPKTAARSVKRQYHLITKERRQKNIAELSDSKMDARINRLRMENRVKKLGRDYGANRITRKQARRLFRNKETFSDKQLSEKLARLERERAYHMELSKATKPTRTAIRNLVLNVSDTPVKKNTGISTIDVWNKYEKAIKRHGYQG